MEKKWTLKIIKIIQINKLEIQDKKSQTWTKKKKFIAQIYVLYIKANINNIFFALLNV